MLNDNEIVTSMQAESDPVDDNTDKDENNNESSKGPSNAGSCSALEIAMKWYEEQSDYCHTEQLMLTRVSETLQRKKGRCTMV
ncbi:UNVERIFIED_CONTAM: hypothetical protein NCL1_27476 [Trichonephila clavipes]